MMNRVILQTVQKMRPATLAAPVRAFASGTTLEKFDFEDPFKLN
jgi:hypothetical protein